MFYKIFYQLVFIENASQQCISSLYSVFEQMNTTYVRHMSKGHANPKTL